MSLKELLGDLYDQVITKLGDNKIAIVSDGNWIPKEKFDSVNEEKNTYKNQVSERDTQLTELKKAAKGSEELSTKIGELQELNKTTSREYEDKLKQQKKDFALELKLRDSKAKNPKAVKALLSVDKILINDDGTITGLDEQLTALKESDGYLFGEDKLGGKPPATGDNVPKKNPFKKGLDFNLTEQARLLRDEPETAKLLMAQAK